nr:hypothetical protein [Mesorhizobium comanense]
MSGLPCALIATWGHRESKLQITDSHRATLDDIQARVAEHRDYVGEVDMAVAVKMREKISLLWGGSCEVDDKQAPAWLQYSSYFPDALFACFAGQMMKHYCGKGSVELSIGKRQCLGSRMLENDFEAGLSRFSIRSDQHLRRRVDAVYRARRSDMPFGLDRKGACPATHIQDGLAWLQVRQVENPLPEGPLPPERHQPNREIVEGGPSQDQAGRARRQIGVGGVRHIILDRLVWARPSHPLAVAVALQK